MKQFSPKKPDKEVATNRTPKDALAMSEMK